MRHWQRVVFYFDDLWMTEKVCKRKEFLLVISQSDS